MTKLILKKKGGDHHHDHQQHSNSSSALVRIVRELDFFDEHKRCMRTYFLPLLKNQSLQEILIPDIFKPAMTSSSPKKRFFPVQETTPRIIRIFGVNLMVNSDSTTAGIDDHLQETSPSFSYASSDHRYQKRKKTISDSLEGVPHVQNNPRIIRLFGVNYLIMSSDDEEKKKRSKAKGKEKIVESQVDSGNSQTFFINEEEKKKKKKKGNPSTKRKRKNPNVHHQEQQLTPPIPPLFHQRTLEEIQQHQAPVFLFEKKLQFSDVDSGLNRLFITRSEKLMGFLTEEEKRKVEDKDDSLIVITRDTEGNEYTLHLTRWPAVGMIVLKHDWRKLVKANGLQNEDSVQGWGCRRGDEFRLALNVIRKQH